MKENNIFPNDTIHEIIYIVISSVLFVSCATGLIKFSSTTDMYGAVLAIAGTLHLLASNMVSYLYNVQKEFLPISPGFSPAGVKVLGIALILVGVLRYFT